MESYLNLLMLLSTKEELKHQIESLSQEELHYVYEKLNKFSLISPSDISEVKTELIFLKEFKISLKIILKEKQQDLNKKLITRFIYSRNNILNWELLFISIFYYKNMEFKHQIIFLTIFFSSFLIIGISWNSELGIYFGFVYMILINILWNYSNGFESKKVGELEEKICESHIGYIFLTILFFPLKIILNLLILLFCMFEFILKKIVRFT